MSNADRDATALLLGLASGRQHPPSDYAYDERCRGKNAQSTAKAIRFLFGAEPVPRPNIGLQWGMRMWEGDAQSDKALMAVMKRGRNPYRIIETMITRGIEGVESPPDELAEVWQQASTEPTWLNWEKLEKGAEVYRRLGVAMFTYQGLVSIDGYRSEAISSTLMSTGQYSDDAAFRRFMLTVKFWTEISEPGGMRRFKPGWQVALRIRLLHSMIRRSVLARPGWSADAHGMPISQIHMLGPVLISSAAAGVQLRLLGYRTSNVEIEAMLHLWKYVGYIMGVDPGLVPDTVQDSGQTLFDLGMLETRVSDENAKKLSHSFLNAFKPGRADKGRVRLAKWWLYRMNIGQTLFFVSPTARMEMGLPNPWFWAMVSFFTQAPGRFVLETVRIHSQYIAKWIDRKARANRRRYIALNLKTSEGDYTAQH